MKIVWAIVDSSIDRRFDSRQVHPRFVVAQPRGPNNYNVPTTAHIYGDGQIIFPWAPPWRARGYPVPAMLFGGEARAAVNHSSSLLGPQWDPVPLNRPASSDFRNSRTRTPYGETRRVTSASYVFFTP